LKGAKACGRGLWRSASFSVIQFWMVGAKVLFRLLCNNKCLTSFRNFSGVKAVPDAAASEAAGSRSTANKGAPKPFSMAVSKLPSSRPAKILAFACALNCLPCWSRISPAL